MTSKERVAKTLDHEEPDRVPLDLGRSNVTGMHVSSVYRLRQALGLDPPDTPVRIIEPFLMLGEIAPDLLDALGVDVAPLTGTGTLFGFEKEGWKRWRTSDGTPVRVPALFNTEAEPNGDLLQYPEGDRTAPPSGLMPSGGYYFDSIIRQPPIDEAQLCPEDNVAEFALLGEEELTHFRCEAERLCSEADRAILASVRGTGFGDICQVPAPWLKHPKGIRDVAEWYVSTATRRPYLSRVFELQCQIALTNLERLHRAVGDRIAAIALTGTDFGAQDGLLISPQTYRDLYKPFHKTLNEWVHTHTTWKTFIHSCGSVIDLLDEFIAAGFDIFNPVQVSAARMDPYELKLRFGDRLVFWGGGIDTQRCLPFGTPHEIRQEVHARVRALGPEGGFVWNAVHNIQAGIPEENLVALFDAFQECASYPLSAAS